MQNHGNLIITDPLLCPERFACVKRFLLKSVVLLSTIRFGISRTFLVHYRIVDTVTKAMTVVLIFN